MKKLSMVKEYQKISVILGLSIFSLISSFDSKAEIYKCVKENGVTVYNDKPCPKIDKEITMKAVKDPVGGYIAPTTFTEEKIVPGKYVVVGEGEDTAKNANSLKLDSGGQSSNGSGGSQNSDSQIDGSTEAAPNGDSKSNSTANVTSSLESNPRKYMNKKGGVLMTKEEAIKADLSH